MDYEGQKLSELLFHWIILSFGAVGWIVGYFYQDFSYVFYSWSVGTLISVVVRSRPFQWMVVAMRELKIPRQGISWCRNEETW